MRASLARIAIASLDVFPAMQLGGAARPGALNTHP